MRKQELHPRTAVINKNQKNQSRRARSQALIWLATNFPSAFDNSLYIRPLKSGIMEDILQFADKAAEAGISKSKLREAVVLFTRRLDYLTCLKAREMRVDLQGNVVAEVSIEEAEHASMKIKKRVEKGARNARKIMAEKNAQKPSFNQQSTGYVSKPFIKPSPSYLPTTDNAPTEDYLPTYPHRAPAVSFQETQTRPPRVSSVVVKHKTTRQFDPDAVARLKEKLGLSRSTEEKRELVD